MWWWFILAFKGLIALRVLWFIFKMRILGLYYHGRAYRHSRRSSCCGLLIGLLRSQRVGCFWPKGLEYEAHFSRASRNRDSAEREPTRSRADQQASVMVRAASRWWATLIVAGNVPFRSWFGRCQIARVSKPFSASRRQAVARLPCQSGSLPDPLPSGSGVRDTLPAWSSYALAANFTRAQFRIAYFRSKRVSSLGRPLRGYFRRLDHSVGT
jgi:hypothetical protein